MQAYETQTIERNGNTYKAEWFYDTDHGTPWEESDGHGVVSEWTTRNKLPGEFVLSEDRHGKRFYDFAATMKIAKRDGWGVAGKTFSSKGEQAQAAVMADFELLRGWCNDDWYWCGIIVTLLDDDGEETDITESLWGIESNSDEYHQEVIADLISRAEHTHKAMQLAICV